MVASPAVPIEVDEATGVWTTDGLPMVYLPRHFLVNNHRAVEEALGRSTYREILRAATEKSALHWCRTQAQLLGLGPEATFRHYFNRLSQRGWGQFSVDRLDPAAGVGEIELRNSIFALEARARPAQPACYMFEGFATGAFRFLLGEGSGTRVACLEARCAALGARTCRFALTS